MTALLIAPVIAVLTLVVLVGWCAAAMAGHADDAVERHSLGVTEHTMLTEVER